MLEVKKICLELNQYLTGSLNKKNKVFQRVSRKSSNFELFRKKNQGNDYFIRIRAKTFF